MIRTQVLLPWQQLYHLALWFFFFLVCTYWKIALHVVLISDYIYHIVPYILHYYLLTVGLYVLTTFIPAPFPTLLFSHLVTSWLFVTPWTAACQTSLPFTISQSLLILISIESVKLSNHLMLCHPLFLLPSIFPSIRVFSNESVLHVRWPKYWSFSFSISPSYEYSGLIPFRMDWLDLLAVQGTLKSLLQQPLFKSINSSVLSLLYGPALTFFIHSHTTISDDHKSCLFFYEFASLFLKYVWVTAHCLFLVCNIGIRYIHFKTVITVSLVTICSYTEIFHDDWLYSWHGVTQLSYNWKFVALVLPYCFSPSPLPSPGEPPVCSLYLWLHFCSVMCFHLFCRFHI